MLSCSDSNAQVQLMLVRRREDADNHPWIRRKAVELLRRAKKEMQIALAELI